MAKKWCLLVGGCGCVVCCVLCECVVWVRQAGKEGGREGGREVGREKEGVCLFLFVFLSSSVLGERLPTSVACLYDIYTYTHGYLSCVCV